jgi:hypothetical protein
MPTMKGSDIIPSQEAVVDRMKQMPEKVSETYRTKLGNYRGLEASLILHPLGGTEVVLDGNTRCRETLMRDNPGPRAVLYALERLANGYDYDCWSIRAEFGVKQGQLRDFEARMGRPFEHAESMRLLSDLRDRLEDGLSEKPQQEQAPEGPFVAELAERTARKAARAERPVTARIRAKLGEQTVADAPRNQPM